MGLRPNISIWYKYKNSTDKIKKKKNVHITLTLNCDVKIKLISSLVSFMRMCECFASEFTSHLNQICQNVLISLKKFSTITSCVIFLSLKTNLFFSAREDPARWNRSLLSHFPWLKMDVPADKTAAHLSAYGLKVYLKIQFPVSIIKSVLFYTPSLQLPPTNLQ